MTISVELRKRQEELSAMIQELHDNRVILRDLTNCYSVFRFTGGVVRREPWKFLAMISYLQSPFAAYGVSTTDAERYQYLAGMVVKSGQMITADAMPKSLRRRQEIADSFGQKCAELRTLGDSLESAMKKVVDDLNPPSPLTKAEPRLNPVGSTLKPVGVQTPIEGIAP